MCDTMVAMPETTLSGKLLFAKNSDREPNEAHMLQIIPAADHEAGCPLKLTYISIPQVKHTHRVLLAKPYWIWGAEMGANEHGVVIGNEALFTRTPVQKEPGMIGMDLLRLALERGSTAREAMDIIIRLLDEYGQGGNCGHTHPFFYQNSFLIADPGDAWVLETSGKQWAAEHVSGVRSISNGITIADRWDLASPGLVSEAVRRGWCRNAEDFDFRRCYSEPVVTYFSASANRQACTMTGLTAKRGKIDPNHLIDLLGSHTNDGPDWSPDRNLMGADVCMHVGFGPMRPNQTTGSMISELSPEGTVHWVTGTAAPCTSLFKPVWLDAGMPNTGGEPGGEYAPGNLFWQHERLHRALLEDYPRRMAEIRTEMNAMQQEFLAGAASLQSAAATERLAYSQQCFDRALEATQRWTGQVMQIPAGKTAFYYRQAWKGFNRAAKYTQD